MRLQKMQSAFRGFSTQKGSSLKNLRVIRDVKAEAEAIRRRLVDHQVAESILRSLRMTSNCRFFFKRGSQIRPQEINLQDSTSLRLIV